MKRIVGRTLLIILSPLVAVVVPWQPQPAFAAFGPIQQVNLGIGGEQPNDDSQSPVISTRGEAVAFASRADNLVDDDFNGSADIFIFDRTTGVTTRIVGPEGEFDFDSESPAISGDGLLVAFVNDSRLKVYSRTFGIVQDIVDLFNTPYAFSENGRFLAITADDDQELGPGDFNTATDIYVYDRLANSFGRITRAHDGSEPNGPSLAPAITPDGRYVAYVSNADNLTAESADTDSVYLYDRIGRTTERISGFGSEEFGLADVTMPPAVSGDGRYVAYLADSTDGIALFRRDRQAGTTVRLGLTGPTEPPDISTNTALSTSKDGLRFVVGLFGDFNEDIFLFDAPSATTALVSASAFGGQADGDSISGQLSANGQNVVFVSNATNLAEGPDGFTQNVFVASPAAPLCQAGDVNGDGRVDAADIPALVQLIFAGSE